MTEALEKNIRKVVPYVPGEQPQNPDVIKLNTNENPYSPAPGVARVLKSMDADLLRLYPDPTNGCLVKALADYYELAEDQVFVGIGSDDVLSMSFLTFFNSGKPILFPNVTYSFYDVWADLYRIPYVTCALDDQMMIKKEDYFKENGGIVIPNPNAPTGVYEPLETFEEILQKNTDVVVIVDEAYVDFADGPSARTLIEKYPNLLVVQTFSKSRSMAGMRIGYAMGNKELIKALNDVKYSFNSYTMSRVALLCGVEAVNDKAYFEEHVKKICENPRAKEADMLLAVGGGKCLDTVKLAADHLGKPVFTVPTIASNCAPITKISIGHMQAGEGKHPITPAVAVDGEDVAAFKELQKLGIELEIRYLPSSNPDPIGNLFN